MKTEFEVKFLNIDHQEIIQNLKDLGAKLEKPMRLMRRAVIDDTEMKKRNAFIRVRDEGDKITLTYKQFDNISVDGAKEHELNISDFQTAVDLFAEIGLRPNSIQESKRETWNLKGCEVVLDEWPWLNPYIEIEGEGEQQVKETAKLLGLDWSEAVFGDVMSAYRDQYKHLTKDDMISKVENVRFGDPLPDMLKDK